MSLTPRTRSIDNLTSLFRSNLGTSIKKDIVHPTSMVSLHMSKNFKKNLVASFMSLQTCYAETISTSTCGK